MPIFIDNVLDAHAANAISESLDDLTLFTDGKNTAGKTARAVKQNLQANTEANAVIGATTLIDQAIRKHPYIKHAAIPAKFAKIMINRYEPGMTYGAHVDNAIIANVRTDLSFTLFLSEPDSYEGGELILQKHDGDDAVKLPKGSLYLYPSNTVHYVAPVTKGSRLAAVGWIQSRVRLEEKRSTLFDIYLALQGLKDTEENKNTRLSLLKVQNNLMRLWAD